MLNEDSQTSIEPQSETTLDTKQSAITKCIILILQISTKIQNSDSKNEKPTTKQNKKQTADQLADQLYEISTTENPQEAEIYHVSLEDDKEFPLKEIIDVSQLKPRQKMTIAQRKVFNAIKNHSIPDPQINQTAEPQTREEDQLVFTLELESPKKLLTHLKEKIKSNAYIQKQLSDIKNGIKFIPHEFYIRNGLLICRSHIRGSPVAVTQIVVPQEARQMFLEHFHNSIFTCHYGKDKTVDLILCKYWWPQIYDDVAYWCSRCIICKKRKPPIKTPKAPLKPILPEGPWDIVAVDVCSFNVGNALKRDLVVFVDLFTKYVIGVPTKDQKAQTICDIFMEKIVTQHGIPRKLLSDQGSNFTSQLVESICELLNSKKIFTTPYHPEGDGQTERTNRTLQNLLASQTFCNQEEWYKMVHFAVFVYNCSPSTTTGFSPFFINHGREPNLPLDIIFASEEGTNASVEDYQQFLSQQMKQVLSIVNERQQNAKAKQKKQYDKTATKISFAINDLVYLKRHNFGQLSVDKNNTKKLSLLYKGPY